MFRDPIIKRGNSYQAKENYKKEPYGTTWNTKIQFEMKNSLGRLNGRLETTEYRVSHLKMTIKNNYPI